MKTETAILIGAFLATLGWLYTARRQRFLVRKQHTINVLLQSSFNKEFRDAFNAVSKMKRRGPCPDLLRDDLEADYFLFILAFNHYEFIAAAIRHGDLDERLVYDNHRTNIVRSFAWAHEFINDHRRVKSAQTFYEHLEWLVRRWDGYPPSGSRRLVEYIRGSPFWR